MISIFWFLEEASTFCGDLKLGEGTSHIPDWLMFMRDNLKIFVTASTPKINWSQWDIPRNVLGLKGIAIYTKKKSWNDSQYFLKFFGPVQTSNFTCAEPNTNLGLPKWLSSAVDSNVEPNEVELNLKSGHESIAVGGYCSPKWREKTRERQIVEMKNLFFLQLRWRREEEGDSNNLAAKRRRVFNLACPLLLLVSHSSFLVRFS